jgi:hypothetical protein
MWVASRTDIEVLTKNKRTMKILLLIGFLMASFGLKAQADSSSNGKRPVMADLKPAEMKWAKSEGNQFWFYYQPTQYFFKDTEFNTIMLENGEIIVYLFEANLYLLLPSFPSVPKNKIQDVELASDRGCVFIRNTRGRYWIYDHGVYVSNVERMGTNQAHQVICRSRISDKRYFINESDFYYGPASKAIGILSE